MVAYKRGIRYELNYSIDNGHFLGYGFKTRFNEFETSIKNKNFEGVNNINFKYEDFTNYLYLQGNIDNKFSISGGIEHKHIRSFTNNFASLDDDEKTFFDNSDYLSLLTKIEADTYDNKNFPEKGVMIEITSRSFLSSSNFGENFSPFSQLRALVEGAWSIDRFTFLAQGDCAVSFAEKKLDNFNYSLGGYGKNYVNNFIPFQGYSFSQLEGNSFLKTLGSFRYRVYKKNYVDFTVNYALVADDVVGFLQNESFFKNANTGYSIGISSDTFVGPIELRYARSPENNFNAVYFSAGFWF